MIHFNEIFSDKKHINNTQLNTTHPNIYNFKYFSNYTRNDKLKSLANNHLNDILCLKKNVNTIFHVYQEKYIDGNYTTGFGDFIRSCLFITQFAFKYNFQLNIVINHPISYFLENCDSDYKNNKNYNFLNNTVSMFKPNNWIKTNFNNFSYRNHFVLSNENYYSYINHLSSLKVFNNAIFSYNILFPIDDISNSELNYVKSIFEPSVEMYNYVVDTLNNLQLTKHDYIVLHIRSGDSYLKKDNKLFGLDYFKTIKNEIIQIITNNKCKVLLISDNNEIKYLLKNFFPQFKLYFKDITHTGEGVNIEKEQLKNTLLDFYLMSYCSYIHSFTAYPHGSGFSYWCAKLYDIPYSCKYIK